MFVELIISNKILLAVFLFAGVVLVSTTIPITNMGAQIQERFPLMSGGVTTSTSMVNQVAVTAINATDDNNITVNLNYAGNGTAPAVTVIAKALNLNVRELNSAMSTLAKFLGTSNGTIGGNISLQQGQFQLPNILTGTNILKEGWTSPASITVRLKGNTTTPLHNANIISVEVLPFTG